MAIHSPPQEVGGIIVTDPPTTMTSPAGDTFNEFDPQINQGAHFPDQPFVPNPVVAGSTITISGQLHFDCPVCTVQRECRVEVEASHLSEPIQQNLGKFGNCETQNFAIQLPVPDSPGAQIAITVNAQRNPPLGGWQTDDSFGPRRVDVVTQAQKTTRELIEFVPWVVGGGVAGFALSEASPRVPRNRAVAGGVGVGAAGKLATDQLRAADFDVRVDFPLIEVVAFTALLGSAAFLVNEVTGIFDE